MLRHKRSRRPIGALRNTARTEKREAVLEPDHSLLANKNIYTYVSYVYIYIICII